MSDEAFTWAKAQQVGHPLAKDVLKSVASWANADGESWVLMHVIAFEIERTERSAQRGLAWLLEHCPHLIERSGRMHLREGKLIPVYRLHLDYGPRNTRDALRAEYAARALGVTPVSPQDGVSEAAWGDTGVTPRGDNGGELGVTSVSPLYLKTQTKPETETLCGREAVPAEWMSAFDRVWSAWAAAIPDGAARPLDLAAWIAVAESGADLGELERGALRYLAASPAVKRGGGFSLVRWLAEGRWLSWQPPEEAAAKAAPGPGARFADEAVRAAVVAEAGEAWTASWLDPHGWDPGRRAVLFRTGLAMDRMRQRLGLPFLERLNLTLERMPT